MSYLTSRSDSMPDQVGMRLMADSTSDLSFDILACGACILFPRFGSDVIYFRVLNCCLDSPSSWSPITWWFCMSCCPFLHFQCVTDDDTCSALRAMTAEFVFFIGIASICFSGLLFTLWQLASDRWTVRSITWLMVQIWFGNTTLSFGQASSFHPCMF